MSLTLLSQGDFIDLWFELRRRGWLRLFKNFRLSQASRVINTFSCIDPGSVDWWTIPAVRERWNRMITGNAHTEYQEYVCRKYFSGEKKLRLLSVGCGGGTPEINFAKQGCFSSVEGFDVSDDIVKHASRKIPGTGLDNIRFFKADANTFDYGNQQYDVILFHSSFHHLRNPEAIAQKIKPALKPKGILIIHEYAGPNRNQWKSNQLKTINSLLKEIPEKYRTRYNEKKVKKRVYRPGLLRMWMRDPSEAVNSETLVEVLRKNFNVLEEKSFGGNILHPLLKDIGHHFQNNEEETLAILQKLFNAEDSFLSESPRPDFIFGVYQNQFPA
ncbi:MAG TPA: class I SAM-dependent methyltransferase [Bacteroidia bacterium]|nr:class I SAM-dependent methyltransferase [Bacteroidia bacterium]